MYARKLKMYAREMYTRKRRKKEYAKVMYTRKIYVCVWKGHGWGL